MSFTAWGEDHPNWVGDEATYGAVHRRLTSWLGAASEHQCSRCEKPAANWAYTHNDPDERVSERGLAYSTTARYYVPMCVSCHRYFDADKKGQGKCGTYGGYFRHRRRSETPCADCKRACRDRDRSRKADRRAADVLTYFEKDTPA